MLAAVVAAVLATSCGHAPRRGLERPLRLALLPPHDLSASSAPLADIRNAAELSLAGLGAELVTGARVDEFLAAHRMRHTGGLDGRVAQAARAALGVDALLVLTVGEWREHAPASVRLTMRMVSADADPRVLWFRGASRSGRDHVGLLGLGEVKEAKKLLRPLLAELRDSLRRAVNGRARRNETCPAGSRFAPQTAFRLPALDLRRAKRVAVLPFENRTGRRGAGDVVALEVARGLATLPAVRLVEPGVVRSQMLQFRVILEDGVSLELGDMMLSSGEGEVDLVVSGVVSEYDEGAPAVAFSMAVLDTHTRQVVWRSDSHHRGGDGVLLFGAGTVRSAGVLTCRMVENVVRALAKPSPRARTRASVGSPAILALPSRSVCRIGQPFEADSC